MRRDCALEIECEIGLVGTLLFPPHVHFIEIACQWRPLVDEEAGRDVTYRADSRLHMCWCYVGSFEKIHILVRP